MKLPITNRDLKHYVSRRWILRFFLFFSWVILSYLGADYYNKSHETYPKEDLMLGWKLVVFMLASTLLAFVFFRIFEVLSLQKVEGSIETTGFSHGYTASEDPGLGSSAKYDFRVHTFLMLRTPNGKLKKIKFEQKNGFYLYYYPGTYVCRLPGLSYPLADPNRTVRPEKQFRYSRNEEEPVDDLSNGYLCVACGRLNKNLEYPCTQCGMSLIDPDAYFQN